ncbi:phosphoribosyltransferase [Janthinobacterium sp. 17J80-10]|uniref:phosphoribosyltransferase n=1 Tax=Janthinobacterium sp. 17J80-10 TaxID=2497863 RepID=UPI001005593A|nr:phosphoribosyltransferase [Janthinobacterium sp. 17J80-10]QAU34848.1 phosphoribosyltransferase [Janthinobacterium sp. 17J80-10]
MTGAAHHELRVSWSEYHRNIEELAVLVHRSGWQFDHILCLARGGLRPGDVLSRLFNVPLAILATSSYREDAGSKQGELAIAKHVTMSSGSLKGRVLLVDDLVDSGVTLDKVQRHLQEAFPEVVEARSAVIWYKACSCMRPDYFVQYLETNPWIMQPFEEYDRLGIHGLLSRGSAEVGPE